MKNSYSDDTFLARWLNGDLEDNEQSKFEKSEDYQKYVTIIDKIDTLESLDYNNKEKIYNAIKDSTIDNDNVIRFVPKWVYGVAATLLFLIGIFFFNNTSDTNYNTDYGEQIVIELPDRSEVILNAKSELKFEKSDWKTNRKVTLIGEAFFKVKKGSDFIVETPSGNVNVLGTQFNVNTQKDFFEVTCHEGKVKAIGTNTKPALLTKGKAFRIIEGTIETWDIKTIEPSWISGETTFVNTPLKQVIQSLENQFNITFVKENIDQNQRFTGSYNNGSIELALKTVFVPMEISYNFNNKSNIVLVKE